MLNTIAKMSKSEIRIIIIILIIIIIIIIIPWFYL